MTVKRNLLIAFGLSLLLLIITSVASYVSIRNLLDSAGLVNHTNQVIQNLEGVISTLKDAETGQRGYLLTGRNKFLEPYNGALPKAISYINATREMTSDNPVQTKDLDALEKLVQNRMTHLQSLIETKRNTGEISQLALDQGREMMDEARLLVNRMQEREQSLLNYRTAKLNRFSQLTPSLIVVAALLSIVVTVFFFSRLNKDYDRRLKLQRELEEKDEMITRRINLIESLAEKISHGDYQIRVDDKGTDKLGNLAVALNKMASSLNTSFTELSDKEWLQTGVVKLNEKLLGEQSVEQISYNLLDSVAQYTNSLVGAFYISDSAGILNFITGYALAKEGAKQQIKPGEGVVGQAALNKKMIVLKDIPEDVPMIGFGTGDIKPRTIAAVPIFYNNMVKAVLELTSLNDYTENDEAFFHAVSNNTGIVLVGAENLRRLQELLEETQSQAEELQAQHNELETLNSELEVQAQKLQASEEELKVQQEELTQANQEMEEHTRLLEEKNQMIVERNIEIQKKAEDLALSTKYKSEFLANMSHELRTPLNSILLLSRLLAENNNKNLSEEQVEYARVIQGSGNGLLALIDEILDLSKIEAGKMQLEYAKVPITAIVKDINALFAPLAKEKKLEFGIDVAGNVPEFIETDQMRAEQILKNLLSNAFKFTSSGSVHIQVGTSKDEEFISFAVKDTGIGIPKEKQQLIFEAFQQADGSTRRKYGGTGLGLSISRELVKLLGGEIKVSSEPGKGTEFTFYLPKTKVEKAAAQKPVEKATPGEDYFVTRPETPTAEERPRYIADAIPEELPDDRDSITADDQVILIVEDDTKFARALLDFTRARGYKGIVAVRGDVGIELAQMYRPIGILLDIQLPVKDGWEVMEELKSNPATRHIPVHIMSSFEVKRESIFKGAVDFINKPVAFEQMHEVFKKIEQAINRQNKKVLIIEENAQHAKALSYFLSTNNVNSEISNGIVEGIDALEKDGVNCVILDMGIPDQKAYETLDILKKKNGLENLPVIIFTGKSLSTAEEQRIKQYVDSIVIKTAHSYHRILDEVSLFLHLMEENRQAQKANGSATRLGSLEEVLANKKILIADDDIRNIFSLTRALEIHKMDVLSALDGKDALRVLDENPDVDIVLMDIMMPVMDGYESMRRIRSNPHFRNLPVIAVTAKAMTGDREKCIQAGASDYISKPVDIDQLLSLMRVWLYDKMK